jgi:hypothetical protein
MREEDGNELEYQMVPSPVPSEMAVNLGRGSVWNGTTVLFHNGERVNSGSSGIEVSVRSR